MKKRIALLLGLLLAVCLLLFAVTACKEKPGEGDGGYSEGLGGGSGEGSGSGSGEGSGGGSGEGSGSGSGEGSGSGSGEGSGSGSGEGSGSGSGEGSGEGSGSGSGEGSGGGSGEDSGSGSGEEHTCVFVFQVPTADYIAAEATCQSSATYYFSCNCGKKGAVTFTFGAASEDHDYGEWENVGDGKHVKTCRSNPNHQVVGYCDGGTATCTQKATCSTCGEEYGTYSNEHDYGAWQSDGNGKHVKTCSRNAAHKMTESCDGGTATCDQKATCDTCGEQYGTYSNEHDYGAWQSDGNGKHVKTCSRNAAHTLVEDCGGGKATCDQKATCSACGGEYGESVGQHDYGAWQSDGNGRHVKTCKRNAAHQLFENCTGGFATCSQRAACDTCGGEYGALTEDHVYGALQSSGNGKHVKTCIRDASHVFVEDCGGGTATCVQKATCDTCGEQYGELSDEHDYGAWESSGNGKHVKTCSRNAAHALVENCDGGTATCVQKAVCSTCNEIYGELSDEHDYGAWQSSGNGKHIKTCSRNEGHTLVESCGGGTATCTDKAVCTTCEGEYGALKAHVYINQTIAAEHLATSATCLETATYYYSCDCGANGTQTFSHGVVSDVHNFVDGACTWCNRSEVEGLAFTAVTGGYSVAVGACTEAIISIPAVYRNQPVVAVDDYGFGELDFLEEVIIPDSVKKIGQYAFYNCPLLRRVVIGDGVTLIDENAFYYNKSLTDVTLGESVETIGVWGFYFCPKLQYICLPASLKTIGTQAFDRCFHLVEVENKSTHITVQRRTLQDGYIGRYALNIANAGETFTSKVTYDNGFAIVSLENETIVFDYVGTETHLVFPDYVTAVHDSAFLWRTDITGVTFGSNMKKIGDTAFGQCSNLTGDLVIPDTMTEILGSAFQSTAIRTVTIGEGITKVDYQVFSTCRDMVSVVIGKNVQMLETNAFSLCNRLGEVINYSPYITVEKGASTNHALGEYAVSVYNGAAPYQSQVQTDENGFVMLANGDEKHLLDYLGTATDVVIPEGITHIHQYALHMKDMVSLTFASTVKHVERYAVCECDNLENLTLNEGLLTIGNSAFESCDVLPSVTLPASLQRIGIWSFRNSKKLTSAVFTDPNGWCRTAHSDYSSGSDISYSASIASHMATLLSGSHSAYGNYYYKAV